MNSTYFDFEVHQNEICFFLTKELIFQPHQIVSYDVNFLTENLVIPSEIHISDSTTCILSPEISMQPMIHIPQLSFYNTSEAQTMLPKYTHF